MLSYKNLNSFFYFVMSVYFFIIQFTLRTPLYEERGVDTQVILRLGVMFLCFILALILNNLTQYKAMIYSEKIFWFFLFFIFLSSFKAGFYGVYCSTTLIITAFSLRVFINSFGVLEVSKMYVRIMFLFALVSLYYYYFDYDIGRYSYWTLDYFFVSERMQGVSGHPNTFALMMGSAILFLVFNKKHFSNNFFKISILIFGACLILTDSKTNIIALFTALMIYLFIRKKYNSIFFSLIVISGFAFFFISVTGFYEFLLINISRSGDLSEILSFTGRTDIWLFVLGLIEENLILGWGYTSATELLVSRSEMVGFTVAQTHNLILQLLLSLGIVGLFLFVFLVFCNIKYLFSNKPFEVYLYLIVYLLIVGISETVIFNTVASNSFLIFTICVLCSSNMLKKQVI